MTPAMEHRWCQGPSLIILGVTARGKPLIFRFSFPATSTLLSSSFNGGDTVVMVRCGGSRFRSRWFNGFTMKEWYLLSLKHYLRCLSNRDSNHGSCAGNDGDVVGPLS
ncbi:hypothetical protein TanjilG_03744 [Lupinus angustifolius]|uniref:Uncharacterized protein n=1 Tax=Lupinus angustifolius TaxID=3871 RepID=A0A1J7H4V1_LUPAN|nr:hypothetical protein TanjilG_03744 [Lupinus angustifolius]